MGKCVLVAAVTCSPFVYLSHISLRHIYVQLTHLELLKMVKISERAQAEERRKTRLDSPHPAGKIAVDLCVYVCVVLAWNILSCVCSQPPHHFSLEGRTWTHRQTREGRQRFIHTNRAEWRVVLLLFTETKNIKIHFR